MVQKDTVYKQVAKYKGNFNYSDLYTFCYNWLKDEGYLIKEKEYVEKISGAKEIKIEWEAFKKISDYYKNTIVVKWHILQLTDVEVEENGKKIKTNKGDLKMTFEGVLEKDYEENWEKTAFWKMMRGIYDKYIIRTTTDEYEVRLIQKTESYIEEVKAFLDL